MDQATQQAKMPTGRKWAKRIGCGCLTLIIAILALSASSNFFFPTRSKPADRLSDLEKARIAEAFHLRKAIGDKIWTGWSNAPVPIIVYNEAYAFLVGLDNPDSGWHTVPQNVLCGGPWELVPDEAVDGRKYFRLRLVDERTTPQAFTVRVGDFWCASMTTKDWMLIKMGNDLRDSLPSAIKAIVPYRLIARIFVELSTNTDSYISLIEHESFHAYQGIVSAGRLASAETVLPRFGKKYPWSNTGFNDAWKAELDALADALSASQEQRMVEFATRFISLRQARRKAFQLDADLLNLERFREWEEGLAKYTELAIWKHAASDSVYKPVQALSGDPDFKSYGSFARKWAEELITLRHQSKGDGVRFYYSGMAQAFLLDRLNPDWRARILHGDVFLEDLLSEALARRKILP